MFVSNRIFSKKKPSWHERGMANMKLAEKIAQGKKVNKVVKKSEFRVKRSHVKLIWNCLQSYTVLIRLHAVIMETTGLGKYLDYIICSYIMCKVQPDGLAVHGGCGGYWMKFVRISEAWLYDAPFLNPECLFISDWLVHAWMSCAMREVRRRPIWCIWKLLLCRLLGNENIWFQNSKKSWPVLATGRNCINFVGIS